MFNPKAFVLFAFVVTILALAVDARLGIVNVWLALAGGLAIVVIELLMTLGPMIRPHARQR
jgi:hypothetical protein